MCDCVTHLKTKRAQLGDLEIFLHQAEYKVGCWSDKLVRTEGKTLGNVADLKKMTGLFARTLRRTINITLN